MQQYRKKARRQKDKKTIDEKHAINSSKAAIPPEGKKSIDDKHEISSSKALISHEGKT